MKFKAAAYSTKGFYRTQNEDNLYFNGKYNRTGEDEIEFNEMFLHSVGMYAVFDGMGGEGCGNIASKICSETLAAVSGCDLEQAVLHINDKVCEYMKKHSIDAMGSTAAILKIDTEEKIAKGVNIGDSKIYHIRDDKITLLSRDHNLAGNLMMMNLITEEESYRHKDKNKLTQHIGISENDFTIEPELTDEVMLMGNELFLICSDGLTDGILPETVKSIVTEEKKLKICCKRLVECAEQNGSRDNITVILIKIC